MSKLSKVQSDLFQTKQEVLVDQFFTNLNSDNFGKNTAEASTLLLKCEELGFSFDKELFTVMTNAKTKELENFWDWFESEYKKVYGAAKYKPMYPNFPKQVVEASEAELLVNAFMHYTGDLFGVRIVPKYKEKDRKPLKEEKNPLRLKSVKTEDILNKFTLGITANTSLSVSNKEALANMFSYLEEAQKESLEKVLGDSVIPQKENLAFIGALVIKSSLDFEKTVGSQFKTPTDLLRLVAALNGGDTSLAVNTKVKNLSRSLRRMFVSKIDEMFKSGDSDQFLENMFTYKEKWTRFAYALHVGEYEKKYPLAFEALQKVRNNEKGETFNYKVEKLVKKEESVLASELLLTRPGVFGRMLNQLLVNESSNEDKDTILKNFKSASKSIATPVLLQIHAKFKYDNQNGKKIILPKGGLGKVYVKTMPTDAKKPVDSLYAKKIVDTIEDTLINRFKTGESLGNVFIEDSLMLQNVPFAQRTASKALKTVPKGSRFVKESDKPIIRFFTWWNENGVDKEGNKIDIGRIDIDLSVGIFDVNYNLIKTCAYYDLRSYEEDGVGDYLTHSGDITSAPNGAAEYIDVDIEKLKEALPEAAYVGQLISSFTEQKYADMPECYAGWMEREQKQHGKIFEPSTVKNKVDITCDATNVLVCLYDIARKEYIWADTPMRANYSYCYNNLNTVRGIMAYTIEGIAEMTKANLYDLFEMHAKARGKVVPDKSKADTVFSLNEGITPFDHEVIASDFMANEYHSKKLENKPKC